MLNGLKSELFTAGGDLSVRARWIRELVHSRKNSKRTRTALAELSPKQPAGADRKMRYENVEDEEEIKLGRFLTQRSNHRRPFFRRTQ